MENVRAKRRARQTPIRMLDDMFKQLENRPSLATLEFWGLAWPREWECLRDASHGETTNRKATKR